MHFSFIPPKPLGGKEEEIAEIGTVATAPEVVINPNSPGKLFLPQFVEAAKRHGGFPSWLGQWWASRKFGIPEGMSPAHAAFPGREIIPVLHEEHTAEQGQKEVGAGKEVKKEGGIQGIKWMAGSGRVWVVKGKQWTEDMNRFPSNRLRVEFDGPDVSQEVIYTLFRVSRASDKHTGSFEVPGKADGCSLMGGWWILLHLRLFLLDP